MDHHIDGFKRHAVRVSAMTIALVSSLVLCGCATFSAPRSGEPPPTAEAPKCFRVSSIDDWRAVDERRLLVYGPRRDDVWLLRLFSSCPGLNFTQELGFRARGTAFICGDPGDEILFGDTRCAINSVRMISPAEAAALSDSNVREDIGKDPALKQAPSSQP